MTENEAIDRLQTLNIILTNKAGHEEDGIEKIFTFSDITAICTAIEALEEIQQYRAIGTVEGYKRALEISKENFRVSMEYKAKVQEFESIGTIEEFKALKEKNTPYKPQEYEDRYYACKCDNILLPKWRKYPTELMSKSEGLPHCMACGQKLDWGE